MTHLERDPRMHDFDFLIGSWEVDHRRLTHRLAGADEWEHFAGTAVCRKVLDGVGNVDEITMLALGSVGMTVRLFNHATRPWSLHWASSLTGVFEPPVVGGFDNGIGHFYGDDVHDGGPIRVRYVWDRTHRRARAGTKTSPPTKSGPGGPTGS
jgi:hypothetical protein